MGRFAAEMRRLSDEIGRHTTITLEVDQVYAHYQEVHPEFHHPDGGQAYYLRDSLFTRITRWMNTLAEHAITKDGTDWTEGAVIVSEGLSQSVFELAPVEFSDLRSSGHPTVDKDGVTVYDRAPRVRRLEKDDLRLKHQLQRLLDPTRYAYEPSQIKWRTDPAYKWGSILQGEGKRHRP